MFKFRLLAISAVSAYLAATGLAQSREVHRIAVVPLTVEKGFPLKVVLTDKVRAKLNEPVHGRIVDPVYALDREVIPAGTEILGTITGLRPVGKLKRVSSLLGGDLTPLHEPEITFDTLVLGDKTRIPIVTSVVSRKNVLVRYSHGETHAFTTGVQQPANELIHSLFWGLLPYHPQLIPTGTTYKANLIQPLEFGSAFFGTTALAGIGSAPPAGSILYARLLTALDSENTKTGAPVQAILTRPLYSLDHRLIFPAGSKLQGKVDHVDRARLFANGARLAITFTKIEPPISLMSAMSQIREIHGHLVGIETPIDLNQLRLDQNGLAQVARTNQRFFAPAFAFAGAVPMLSAAGSGFGAAFAESYGTSFFSRVLGGGTGFGIPGAIAGMMVPPVGVGMGIYGVGYAVYFNLVGHGKNITLPTDTSIEVRLDSPGTFVPNTP